METSKYIKPPKHTLDQALMFIPSEAIYYDLLANKIGAGGVSSRNMMQYALEKSYYRRPKHSFCNASDNRPGPKKCFFEIHKDTEKFVKILSNSKNI